MEVECGYAVSAGGGACGREGPILPVLPWPVGDSTPIRPIHVLVPYAPGGISDIVFTHRRCQAGARFSCAVVENWLGGNGFIVSRFAAPRPFFLTASMVMTGRTRSGQSVAVRRHAPQAGGLCRSPRSKTRLCSRLSPHRPGGKSVVVDAGRAAIKCSPAGFRTSSPGNGKAPTRSRERLAPNTGTCVISPAHSVQGRAPWRLPASGRAS